MKRTKKIVALLLAAVLLVTTSVAVTVAYLTSTTEVVKNTFTVGKVAITLDEAVADEYGVVADVTDRTDGNEYKLIPGHTYTKDPTVHVDAKSEECWLFVKVVNGLKDIIVAGEQYGTIEAQMTANGWELIDEANGVWAYETTVDPAAGDALDVVVFNSFTVDGEAEVEGYVTEDNAAAKIDIVAYAVQADGFTTAAAAWEAAPANW